MFIKIAPVNSGFLYKRLLPVAAACLLVACGGSNTNTAQVVPVPGCTETGVAAEFACKTGATEPLYTFQWALQYVSSYFKEFTDTFGGGSDLNVETAHQAGIKGQGVNVLVLDDGMDINHEDLKANVDPSMTFNFYNNTTDPTPTGADDAHGTNAAGIIAAAQNGKGVMGIAPRATLGGAAFVGPDASDPTKAYGGADWAKKAHVFNASYGNNPTVPPSYESATTSDPAQVALEALPKLRDNKGAIYVKASGNEFVDHQKTARDCSILNQLVSCENPAHDTETLIPTVIVVGAANAKGQKASYSNAGTLNWVTGFGGESGSSGKYGEGAPGPTIFSTDLSGCAKGYSITTVVQAFLNGTSERNGVKDNANCNYSHMNGTSAATPTISGVVALVLQANPALTWRDVRDILRQSARQIDPNYKTGRDKAFDLSVDPNDEGAVILTSDTGVASSLTTPGATKVPLELGWVKNAAGIWYSSWYGFGLPDADKAVKLAKEYAAKPSLSKASALTMPAWTPSQGFVTQNLYGKVSKIGAFTAPEALNEKMLDQLQLRLTGSLCVGSVGVAVKSPSGTVSLLSIPYNIYHTPQQDKMIEDYGLGSYAFYGEKAKGEWEVYLVAGKPKNTCAFGGEASVQMRFVPQP
jgi:subtilisin family serine protease